MPQEIGKVLETAGEKGYRGRQVFQWVQDKAAQSWREMRNLSMETKTVLDERFLLQPARLVRERLSRDGTRKYLWLMQDRQAAESVLLYHFGDATKDRHTICLSTQVGCPMGCVFCATGKQGFARNLSAAEITGQVLDITAIRRKDEPGFKINNLVFMGMGEPLLNLPAVVKSIKILNHKEGQNIGIRRVTVSTCGLVPQIELLAAEGLDIVLAVSLHAPNDELRNQIMPVNKQYPLEVLLEACRGYIAKTGRRITFEYALIKNFNDTKTEARQLAQLLRGMSANVNIIPVNSVNDERYSKPPMQEVYKFLEVLKAAGVQAVVREEKGSDIEAACGQLAGKVR